MKYYEYKEFRVPAELIEKAEKASLEAQQSPEKQPPTFGDVGIYDWLSKLSEEGGWRFISNLSVYPIFVMEREVNS